MLRMGHEGGRFFAARGAVACVGHTVGKQCRRNDLQMNVYRARKMTNIRAAGADRRSVVLKQALTPAAADSPGVDGA